MRQVRTRARWWVALVAGATMAVLAAGVVGAGPAGAAAAPSTPRSATVEPAATDESVAMHVNATHDGNVTGGTERPPLSRKWSRNLGSNVSYPLITGGRVFATAVMDQAASASLFALDAETGEDVWGPIDIGGASVGLTAGDGQVFTLNTSGFLQAFDQETGAQTWITDVPYQYSFSSAPTYFDGMVYTGAAGSGGNAYAFDASSGDLVWTRSVANGDNSSPAVTADGMYVSYACYQTYDFDPKTGEQIWHAGGPCSGGGGATVAVAGGRVWANDWALGPITLDAATGATVGTFPAGPLPAFEGSRAIFLDGKVLKARNIDTLAPMWSQAGDQNFVTSPIVVNGYVYEGSSTGKLYALDETTGVPVWVGDTGAPMTASNGWGQSSGLAAGQGLIVAPATNLLVAFAPDRSGFTPVSPKRLLDTRTNQVPPTWPASTPVGGGQIVGLPVTGGSTGVPTDARAVVLNVTATDVLAPTFVTVYPGGTTMPNVSNLNLVPGDTRPNLVTVAVGADGTVDLANQLGDVNLIADVMGYYSPASTGGFTPVGPRRIVDTRTTRVPPTSPANTPVGPGGQLDIPMIGIPGMPADVTAVVLNVTATDPTSPTVLTAFPKGQTRPATSNLNVAVGQTIPNLVVVGVGADGGVSLWNKLGSVNAIVDVVGAYGPTGAGRFTPIDPQRMLDSRLSPPAVVSGTARSLAIRGAQVHAGPGITDIVSGNATAAVMNVTATDVSVDTFITVYAGNGTLPSTSNLNIDAGETRSNLDTAVLGANGKVDIANANGSAQVVIDLFGYFTS